MRIISVADHRKADGGTDWVSYTAASQAARKQDVDDGVYCSRCGAYLFPRRGSGRQMCGECLNLSQPQELTHSKFVRCPSCGRAFRPSDTESYNLYEDGEHSVTCQECDHQYEISTHVSYSFMSPARITGPQEDDKPEGATDGAL